MRHPTEGTLRRLVDEPAGVAASDREHIESCAPCLASLATVREDAALVGVALASDARPDMDVAWRRLATTTADPDTRTTRPHKSRLRAVLSRPAVASVAVLAVLAGAGTAAANDWFQIFGTEKIAPFSLSTDDLIALPDLAAYGEFAVPSGSDVHEVPDAATAARESGLDVPKVATLPRGVHGVPKYQVGTEITATFTFSAARAAQAAAKAGKPLPTPPPGLDGHAVRLVAGPGVAEVWGSTSGVPALVVGRAVAPKAFSSGVPFDTVRDYMLSLPGLPAKVAAQLRTFTADGSTLPLPVPADKVRTSSADVGGVQATVLEARDRTMAAAVWVEDGVVTLVAGSLDTDEVLDVARTLR